MAVRHIVVAVCLAIGIGADYTSQSQSDHSGSSAERFPVENRSLRLVVETSDDLSSYTVTAEFAFRLRDATDVTFAVPGAATPSDFRMLEVDGRPLGAGTITVDSSDHSSLRSFVLSARRANLRRGEHVLRVGGPTTATPARGFTQWGGWHPRLTSQSNPVPIALEVHTSSRFTVVASGHRTAESNQFTHKVSSWHTAQPQQWMFLSIGSYRTFATTGSPAFDIVVPEETVALDPTAIAGEARQVVRFLETTFGRDPAAQFRLVVFPSPEVERFSVDGLIAVSSASEGWLRQGGPSLRALLSHEIAHYWWGDMVPARGAAARWLSESFAEYSRYLYETSVGGEPLPWSFRNLTVLSRFAAESSQPSLSDSIGSVPDELYYQKGTFVLQMLRDEIGQRRLVAAMRRLAGRRSPRPATLAEFQSLIDEECVCRLEWFFSQWLRRPAGPSLGLDGVTVRRVGDEYAVEGNLVQTEPTYRLAVTLQVTGEQGPPERRTVTLSRQRTAFSVHTRQVPSRLVVDPDHHLFLWFEAVRLPVTFSEAWRSLRAEQVTAELGPDVMQADRERLLEFLRGRFPRLEVASDTDATGNVIVIGERAATLRRQLLPELDPAPLGTVQAFVSRSRRDASRVIIGIEGDWPAQLPELVPEAPLTFVRYREGSIVSATTPALPTVEAVLRP
jgi:hypothetical protein